MTGFAREQCERDVLSESSNQVRNARQNTTDSLRGLYDLLLALSVIEGPKTLILMSEGLILDTPSDLDAIIRAAAMARVTINVLLMDVPRDDITVGQLGPTVTEDRDMAVSGLADLAGGSRGSLYYVVGTGELIFDRLAGETLAYYMLGVEESSGDRDGKPHRIDVEVGRRNVTVRSRRAFVLSAATTTRKKAEETLLDALKSPFGVAEVPVRVTTFTQKDPASDKARIVVAAEIGQPGGEPEEYTDRLCAARRRRQGGRRRHRQADAVGAQRAGKCAARLPWRDHRRAGDVLDALRRRRCIGAAWRRDSRGQRLEARLERSSHWAICWSATRALTERLASAPASSRTCAATLARSSSCTRHLRQASRTRRWNSRSRTIRTRRRC